MENFNDITKKQVVKIMLLSPIMGGILSSLYLIMYLIYTLLNSTLYESSGFNSILIEFLKLSPLMVLISFVFSYVLGFFLLIPLYFLKVRYEWSDNVFWFFNGLVATFLGMFVAYAYSDINAVIVFVIFISFFSCGLFNASLFTASRNMIIKNHKRLAEFAKENLNDLNVEDKDSFIVDDLKK